MRKFRVGLIASLGFIFGIAFLFYVTVIFRLGLSKSGHVSIRDHDTTHVNIHAAKPLKTSASDEDSILAGKPDTFVDKHDKTSRKDVGSNHGKTSTTVGDSSSKTSTFDNSASTRRKIVNNNDMRFQNLNFLLLDDSEENSKYSSHYCYGGEFQEHWKTSLEDFLPDDWAEKECVFRNIGIFNGRFIYHQNPSFLANNVWGYTNGGAHVIDQPLKAFQTSRGHDFHFVVTTEPIRGYEKTFESLDEFHQPICYILALSRCYKWAIVPGHSMEYIWFTFQSMANSGMLSLQNRMWIHGMQKCNGEYPKIWHVFGDEKKVKLLENVTSLTSSNGLIPLLLIGKKHPREVVLPFGEPSIARLFRDRALAVHGLNFEKRNRIPKIAIRMKTLKHRFTNIESMQLMIRKLCSLCEILLFHPEPLTIKEELQFISNVDVYITPGGGGSYTSVFLKDGATAIYGKYL
jgi:hypothetical protein